MRCRVNVRELGHGNQQAKVAAVDQGGSSCSDDGLLLPPPPPPRAECLRLGDRDGPRRSSIFLCA